MKDIRVIKLPSTLKNDAIGFFEAIKLADLEGKWLRLSAAVQRRFFGRAPFGKKAVRVSDNGEVRTYVTDGFGRDWDEQIYRYDHSENVFVYASGNGIAKI